MEDFLSGVVPKRIGQTLVKAAGIEPLSREARSLSPRELRALAAALTDWTLPVTGTQGFEQAQVTAGGVSMDGFDPETMQSRRVPGLYGAGELMDVDGDCGGFNLQWAWSSALIAARHIQKAMGGRAMTHRYDTQLLIDGCKLGEDALRLSIAEKFEGDSLLAAGDAELMKIHFHTDAPWKLLEYCASLGEIYDVVIEDMSRQTRGLPG